MMSGRRQKAAVEDTDAADASSPQSSHLLELAYDFAASGIPEVDLSVVCEAWAYLTKEVRDQIVKLARGSEGEVSAYPRLAPEHQVHFDRAVVDDTRLFWVAKAWKGLSESVRGEVLGLVNYSWDRGPE
jgi:hypothetical protein